MTDEEIDRLAKGVVNDYRSLAKQNDGVLTALIRDALLYARSKIKAEKNQA